MANEEAAIERIRHRASIGGHDIDEATVHRRYRASMANLGKALDYCEETQVLDNTIAFKTIAVWSKGTLAWWGASKAIGAWLTNTMMNEAMWKRS